MNNCRFKIQVLSQLVVFVLLLILSMTVQAATSLSGSVIDDLGAPAVGYPVELLDSAGEALDVTRTNQVGRFVFNELAAGSYEIEVTANFYNVPASVTAGSKGTAVQPGKVSSISVDENEQLSGYQFQLGISSNYTLISGSIYHDINDNGIRDEGEKGINNIFLDAFTDELRPFREDTSSDGSFTIPLVAGNTYELFAEQAPDWEDGREAASVPVGTVVQDGYIDIVATGGNRLNGYNFGELLPTDRFVISGWIYFDENDDGIRDPLELGIRSLLVDALDQAGEVADRNSTDDNGYYSLMLEAGESYTIKADQPSVWQDGKESASVPSGVVGQDEYRDVSPPAGSFTQGYNFGELAPERPRLTLQSGRWVLASFPGDSGNYTIRELLANDTLSAEQYSKTWVLYVYSPKELKYEKLSIDATIATGRGFWIIQKTDADITIDLPAIPMPETTKGPACFGIDGCYTVMLESPDARSAGNISGTVTDARIRYGDIGITQDQPEFDCTKGCRAWSALQSGIVGPVWQYDSSAEVYTPVDEDTFLEPGRGFFTKADPRYTNLRMAIPLKRFSLPE